MRCFLGIDAGGTRTRALFRDASGKILGRGTAGPANPLKVGFESSEREILRAARLAAVAAFSPQSPPPEICGVKPPLHPPGVGLGGGDPPPPPPPLLRWL